MSKQQPLDPPMVPFAVGGTVAFAVAGVALWISHGPRGWLEICLAGFAWGFVGLAVMIRHDRGRAARVAQARRPAPAAEPPSDTSPRARQ